MQWIGYTCVRCTRICSTRRLKISGAGLVACMSHWPPKFAWLPAGFWGERGHNVLSELMRRESTLPGEWEYLSKFRNRDTLPNGVRIPL